MLFTSLKQKRYSIVSVLVCFSFFSFYLLQQKQLNRQPRRHHFDEQHERHEHKSAESIETTIMGEFCNSKMAMAMYMDGMQFTYPKESRMCLIYVFKGVVVDTQAKYIGAIFVSYFLGVITDMVRCASIIFDGASWMKAPVGATILYTMQLTLAYIIMLVIMSYDVGFLLAAVFGLSTTQYYVQTIRRKKIAALGVNDEHTRLIISDHKLSDNPSTPCCPQE